MKRQSFLKGSAVLMAMVLVTKLIGMIYKVPLTNMLGGTGMSCYSGAFAIFAPVFAAAAAGVPSAMSRLVSEQLALGRYANAVKIKRAALLIFSAVSIVMSLALILSAHILAAQVIHVPQAKWALIGVSLSLFPAAVMNVERGWAEGIGSMTPTASSEIAETIFKAVFGLALPYKVISAARASFEAYHGCFGHYCADMREAMMTAAPYAAAASALGVSLASFAACIWVFIRTRGLSRRCAREFEHTGLPRDMGLRAACRKLRQFTLPVAMTAVVATLSATADLVTISPQLERAIIRRSEIFEHLGEYGIAAGERSGFVYGSYSGLALMIFGLLPTFTAMLGKSALPTLSTAFARRDKRGMTKCLRSMLLLSAGLSLPGGLGICALAEPILRLFFGGAAAEISVSARPLAILGIGAAFMGVAVPCLTALQACEKQGTAAVISISGAGLKLALNILLIPIPALNISGAALSTAISQAVMCVWALAILLKASHAERSTIKAALTPILPALLCTAAAKLTQDALIPRLGGRFERFGVLISIAIGAIICLISFSLLCISPKNQIKGIFSKKISQTT